MRNNFYEVSRTVYGKEVSNMQPVAFDYVPQKKRHGKTGTIDNSASCVGENCPTRGNRLFTRTAVQNG